MATLGGIKVDGKAVETPHDGIVGSISISPADVEHFGAVIQNRRLVTYSGPVDVRGATANRTVIVRVTELRDNGLKVTFAQNRPLFKRRAGRFPTPPIA